MGIRKGTKLTDSPKNIMYQIRVDSETDEKLKYICEKYGITKSEFVRQCIKSKYAELCKIYKIDKTN